MKIKSLFPKKEQVLTNGFFQYENFFPIATIELERSGNKFSVPIIYTFFESSNAYEEFFSEGEYGGSFSFQLVDDRCKPTINKHALKINDDYQEFLLQSIQKYNSYSKHFVPIEFPSEPTWWQSDETPLNENGEQLMFICQLDLYEIVDDDYRLFIFYDFESDKVKNIYQRD